MLKMPKFNFKKKQNNCEKYTMEDLINIMRALRSPEGCPWDREQTHYSLIKPMIEEAYEAVDAIEKNDRAKMTEELGDVLLQVVFHSVIAEEANFFEFSDITDRIVRKMIDRHPHIFGNTEAGSPEEALSNWEEIKLKEKGFGSVYQDLKDIPENFPALMRAQKAAKKIEKAENYREISEKDNCFSFLDGIDFANEEAVGELLYEIGRRAQTEHVECELALKRHVDKIIEEKK